MKRRVNLLAGKTPMDALGSKVPTAKENEERNYTKADMVYDYKAGQAVPLEWFLKFVTTGARTTLSELLLEQLSKASKGRAMFQSRGVTRYVKIQPVLPAKGRVGVLKTNTKKPS